MHRLNRPAIALAMGLSALAGFVDALGFIELQGRFVSFMSGNSTQLAVGLALSHVSLIMTVAMILVLFVLGMFGATLLTHVVPRRWHMPVVLAVVAGLLTAALGCHLAGWRLAAIAAMTLAMGAENAAFQRDGEVVVGLTYMTGALVKVGQKLAQAVTGGPAFAWLPFLLLWLGLIAGGFTGALVHAQVGLMGLGVAAIWAAVLAVYAWRGRIAATGGLMPS